MQEIITILSNKCLGNIHQKFTHFNSYFTDLSDEKKLLLTQKGVYPYGYMNSFTKFKQTSFPSIEQCYSRLNDEAMKPKDDQRALDVWVAVDIQDMGEYHDLYLITDVLLLADVFENFRSCCINSYKLDPVHYYTLPGFAWDAMLKMTDVKLDVFSEDQNDMYLMT